MFADTQPSLEGDGVTFRCCVIFSALGLSLNCKHTKQKISAYLIIIRCLAVLMNESDVGPIRRGSLDDTRLWPLGGKTRGFVADR